VAVLALTLAPSLYLGDSLALTLSHPFLISSSSIINTSSTTRPTFDCDAFSRNVTSVFSRSRLFSLVL
jgi:hypothetical protein